jgi:hypothetical protein
MADYKGIKGFKVQSRASDPTANEGQIWYNTTSNALKYDAVAAGAWASGGNLNTARQTLGGAGISQDSALAFGGSPNGSAVVGVTESYNGSAWTEVADLNTPRRYFVGLGTQTAAMACGGHSVIKECESWNGTSWTEVGDLTRSSTPPVSCTFASGFGSTTSAMFNGGAEGAPAPPPPSTLQICEQWNGTSWTEVADLVTAMTYAAGTGTSGTSGLSTAGATFTPGWGFNNKNQEWNATSWTELADINTARTSLGGAVQGSTTSALVFGGTEPPNNESDLTEKWNGTSWTEVADLANARHYVGGAGVANNALCFGGVPPTPASSYNVTEEWSGAPAVVKTVTVS